MKMHRDYENDKHDKHDETDNIDDDDDEEEEEEENRENRPNQENQENHNDDNYEDKTIMTRYDQNIQKKKLQKNSTIICHPIIFMSGSSAASLIGKFSRYKYRSTRIRSAAP